MNQLLDARGRRSAAAGDGAHQQFKAVWYPWGKARKKKSTKGENIRAAMIARPAGHPAASKRPGLYAASRQPAPAARARVSRHRGLWRKPNQLTKSWFGEARLGLPAQLDKTLQAGPPPRPGHAGAISGGMAVHGGQVALQRNRPGWDAAAVRHRRALPSPAGKGLP